MVMIAVKVPAGAVPGDKVDAVYDGRRVSFVVPPSVRPGQSVHVPVPASDNRKGSPELQARLQKLRATSSRKLKTPSPTTTPSSSPLLLFTKKTPPASPARPSNAEPVAYASAPGEAPDDITASGDPPPRPPPRRDENGARAFAGAPRQSPPAAVAAAMPYADVEGESADFCGWLEPIRSITYEASDDERPFACGCVA